ncbi:MAG TPA: methionine synthase, partial [Desulfovibrio sp.]|nr:methionine synthase [Desulfovibrio sp.]
MPDFRAALKDGRTLLFDGGYGTLLQSRGLPAGLSPELWGLKAPEVVAGVHRDYLEAGARVLTTNTFGGTRFKLAGAADARALNREMARLARGAAGDAAFVAGSVGPTGHFIQPLGELTFREMVAAFREQIQGLAEGGADLILGETHFDLAEARAVVIAAREACDLPVALTMTFEGPATLTGSDPLVCLDALQNMGLDLLGTNCSAGPEQMAATVRAMLPRLSVPLLVQPNAGLPELENGKTVFRLGPEQFAEQTARLADLGAKALGGCCGSTPAHIRALAARLKGRSWSL